MCFSNCNLYAHYPTADTSLFQAITGQRRFWWTGLSDENSEGIWYGSRSNRIIKFTSWAPNNPDGGSEENYAVLYTQNNFDWHDRPKSYFYYPICQFL